MLDPITRRPVHVLETILAIFRNILLLNNNIVVDNKMSLVRMKSVALYRRRSTKARRSSFC